MTKNGICYGDEKRDLSMARKSYLAVKMGKPEELYDSSY
jgi:hypothetical protein